MYLDYYEHGERKTEFLRIYINPADEKSKNPILRNAFKETIEKAKLIKLRVETRLINKEHDIPVKIDKSASFFAYFDKLASTRNQNWTSVRKHLKDFAGTNLTFGNIDEEFLSDFQAYLCSQVKDVTACSYFGILTTCLNKAVKDKKLLTNPSSNVEKVRGKETPLKYLTKEQLQILEEKSEGIPQWFKDAFFFSCYTGLRLSDVETLTWDNIRYTRNSKNNLVGTITKVQEKTGETVIITLTKQAEGILNRQIRTEGKIFKLKGRTTTKRKIERWRKNVGFYFSYHSSRHTFGTMLQTSGVDIHTTSKLMGHKRIEMTLRYARVIDKQRDLAIETLSNYLN